jgi:hypothetical protein
MGNVAEQLDPADWREEALALLGELAIDAVLR